MRTRSTRFIMAAQLGVVAALLIQTGCDSSSKELGELRDQQKQILAKLDAIEKKIAQPAARPAAERRRPGPDPDTVHTIPVGESPIRGPEDAPVTIVEFSDYQCPFCARSEPLIAEALKAYEGKARFVYKHFPLVSIHQQALPAAKAAVAAQKQGKFWEMHDLLFKNQRALQPQNLKQYAEQLGLDVQKFETDMNSPEVQNLVQEDMKLAQTVGVRGTPTIFVNGKLLRNRSLPGFKELIDPIVSGKASN